MNNHPTTTSRFCLRLLAVVAAWCWSGQTARAAAEVLVLKSYAAEPYDQAVAGFLAHWPKCGATQTVRQCTLADVTKNGNPAPAAAQAQAVVSVGTEATAWAVWHTTGPVIFCMVANPHQKVLAGLSGPELARVRGVSLNVPVHNQFATLHDILPKAKRIGVVFDPQQSAGAVAEASAAATRLGCTVVSRPVTNEAALPEALVGLDGRVDAVWAPVDATVYNPRSAQFVLRQMLQRQVPVVGFSENLVKAGALFAPCVNYQDIGRQTAELLAAVLRTGAPAGGTVQPPQRFNVVVNAHVSRLLNRPIKSTAAQPVSFINED